MKRIKIACFDVYYYKDYAKACSVLFEVEPVERVFAHYCEEIDSVDGYVSGQFYKRELPCLLKVYNSIKEDIGLIIVDGFAFLGGGRKGLGAYLFEALDGRIPVIGVAKAFFKGCTDYLEIHRGQSSRPLYITSAGIGLGSSAKLIKHLSGDDRLPVVLKMVDQLTRSDAKN